MNALEVQTAIEARLQPEPVQGVFDELQAGNAFLERMLLGLRAFLRDYVQLPPKDVVLEGFGDLVDALLLASPLSGMVKVFIRGAAMIAAGQIYDMIAQLR